MCMVGESQRLAFFWSKDSSGVTIYYWPVNSQALERGIRRGGRVLRGRVAYPDTDAFSHRGIASASESVFDFQTPQIAHFGPVSVIHTSFNMLDGLYSSASQPFIH
jgi:hypothetical protein